MGRLIEPADIERVRGATDLVSLVSADTALRARGRLLWGRCPFHEERTPSFAVDVARGRYRCFGCGQTGDVFAYVMRRDGLTFPEAVARLAEEAHVELACGKAGITRAMTRISTEWVLAQALGQAQTRLADETRTDARAARAWLYDLGITRTTQSQSGLGLVPAGDEALRDLAAAGVTAAECETMGVRATEAASVCVAVRRAQGSLSHLVCEDVGSPVGSRLHVLGATTAGQTGHGSAGVPGSPTHPTNFAILPERTQIRASESVLVTQSPLAALALRSQGATAVASKIATPVSERNLRLLAAAGATRVTLVVRDTSCAHEVLAASLAAALEAGVGIDVATLAADAAPLRVGPARDLLETLLSSVSSLVAHEGLPWEQEVLACARAACALLRTSTKGEPSWARTLAPQVARALHVRDPHTLVAALVGTGDVGAPAPGDGTPPPRQGRLTHLALPLT